MRPRKSEINTVLPSMPPISYMKILRMRDKYAPNFLVKLVSDRARPEG